MKTTSIIITLLFYGSLCYAQNVVQVEYFLDNDAGFGKNKLVNVTATPDGSFSFTTDLTNASAGYHKLYFRTKNTDGNWSLTSRRNIEVVSSFATRKVTGGEYFFDSDPGFGGGNSITVSPQDSIILQNFTSATNSLAVGYHKLYIRTKDNEGKWSMTSRRNVEVVPLFATRKITAGEYFFDNDPGFGAASLVSVTPQDSIILQNFTSNTANLSIGYHKLYIRLKDNEDKWSLTSRRNMEMTKALVSVISGAEYFFKTDSGFGKANPVNFASPSADGSFSFNIPLNKIPTGTNTLYIRARDSVNSNWSITQWLRDSVVTSSGNDSLWSHAATWSNNKVPDINTVVILHHKVYVDIPSAVCKSLAPYRNDARCIVMPDMKVTIAGHL